MSTRKRPRREDKPLREINKIAYKVFDRKTLDVLVGLMNTRVFKSIDYPLASGKDAYVFRGTRGDGTHVAIKIFKYETTAFRHAYEYLEGDPRFNAKRVRGRLRDFVRLWARKEFANLQACADEGVSVPQPIAHRDNVIVMEFLGERGVPYALLEDVVVANPRLLLAEIVAQAKLAWQAGIVHADLSSFNVVMRTSEGREGKGAQTPVLIDWAQGVSVAHPRAREFLAKDCHNVASFFKRLGLQVDEEQIARRVTG
ncbi:MAG: RIO1 family regulatory kinase/ATPase [Candidatus Micrarchaeota archaeon]